jgi:hypothetical protein
MTWYFYNIGLYCEKTQSEEQHLLKCVYSMMPIIQINFILYKMGVGKNRVGSKRKRGRDRKREGDYGVETEHRRESDTLWLEK